MQYPYYSPQVLTDDIFLQYGGQTGTSSAAQRQAAYLLAEEQMTEHLSAFLVPTVITGSAWYKGRSLYETEYGYIQSVLLFTAEVVTNPNPMTTSIYTGSSIVRNAEEGLLDVFFNSCGSCGGYLNWAYRLTVAYRSGLASGTVTQPSMLAALSLAAQINLNEWDVSLSNEGYADIGIQSFANQGYSEVRKKLGNTVFGSSAAAQRIKRLTQKYRVKNTARFR